MQTDRFAVFAVKHRRFTGQNRIAANTTRCFKEKASSVLYESTLDDTLRGWFGSIKKNIGVFCRLHDRIRFA